MPGPSSFDRKVYGAMEKTDYIPDEFKTWLPRYLRYLSALQVNKTQIAGIMGEVFKNIGDAGQPTFVSPWRHYAAGVSTYGKARYYKDYIGIVHLDGLAETTGTPTSETLFTLPAGYRPSQQELGVAMGAPGGAHQAVRVDILQTGDVQVANPPYNTFTANSWVSLFNIHFRAA
jgi:hypothetical protein